MKERDKLEQFRGVANFEIDIYLDVDKGDVKLCVVGRNDSSQDPHIWGMPINTKHGWVPYLNTIIHNYSSKTQFRIASVPIDMFGRSIECLFDSQ